MSELIDWNLIKELYKWDTTDSHDWIYFMMIEKTLGEIGWTGVKKPTNIEYQKMWTQSNCIINFTNNMEKLKHLQWGYNLIDQYCSYKNNV